MGKTSEGNLKGTIEIPMAIGLVGGATATHPTAKTCVKILDVKIPGGAAELSGNMCCRIVPKSRCLESISI